jgi:hypothetical protein
MRSVTLVLTIIKKLTLPKWEKDDRFDGEKFDDRIKRPEQVSCGKVEEEQGVQGHRNARKSTIYKEIFFTSLNNSNLKQQP